MPVRSKSGGLAILLHAWHTTITAGLAHTAKNVPWRIETYLAFTDDRRAVSFEKCLKSGSGIAFRRKRL